MAGYNKATQEVARPSEVLAGLVAHMGLVQRLGQLVTLDTGRLLRTVMLQQSQPRDATGQPTLTAIYTDWSVSPPGTRGRGVAGTWGQGWWWKGHGDKGGGGSSSGSLQRDPSAGVLILSPVS